MKHELKCIINDVGGWHVPHDIVGLHVFFPVN